MKNTWSGSQRHVWIVPFLITILATLVLISPGSVDAKKPVKPPPSPVDGGTIYYVAGENLCAMNPDGTGKTVLMACSWLDACEPSATLHYCATHDADERWFLMVRPCGSDTYPNGIARHELFAVCEGGAAYRLTDDADLEPSNLPGTTRLDLSRARPRWFADDGGVSYLAKRWVQQSDGSWVVGEWGLHTLSVDPEKLSTHVPASPSFVDVSMALSNADQWHGGLLLTEYDWKPDGKAFVHRRYGGLRLAESGDEGWVETQLTDDVGWNPRWSPTASLVVFTSEAGDIETLDPFDPTDRETLIPDPDDKKKGKHYVWLPLWSPNGTHLAFCHGYSAVQDGKSYSDLRRAASDGSDEVNLTDDTDAWVEPILGWRGE